MENMYALGSRVGMVVLVGSILLMALEAGLRWYRSRDTRMDLSVVLPPVGRRRGKKVLARKVLGARLMSVGTKAKVKLTAFWLEGWGVIAHGPARGRGGEGIR